MTSFKNFIQKDEVSTVLMSHSGVMNSEQPYNDYPYIEYPYPDYTSARTIPATGTRKFVMAPEPMIDFGEPASLRVAERITSMPRRLYLIPTRDDYPGSEYDQSLAANEQIDSPPAPTPTPLDELPNLEEWITKFSYSLIEIWNGKRPAMQLARWSHRRVFATLVTQVGAFSPSPKIRRVHIHQPIEGVAESVVLLRMGNRIRSLILRFEGVDKRWVCTQMWLL